MKELAKWIEAAKILIENPSAKIICPDCGRSYLIVRDEQLDKEHFDRHLNCRDCGAHETILKKVTSQ